MIWFYITVAENTTTILQSQIEKYKNSLKDPENLIEFNKIAHR
jgi:hypothetical protein